MDKGIEYDIVVSDSALAMLDNHVDFLAKVNTNAATKMMNEILDDISSLSENPQRFPLYENPFIPDCRYRRMLSAKRYLVLYEVDISIVSVDYIVDCRQDYEWLIQ